MSSADVLCRRVQRVYVGSGAAMLRRIRVLLKVDCGSKDFSRSLCHTVRATITSIQVSSLSLSAPVISSSSADFPLSSSITPSPFHTWFKTCFTNTSHCRLLTHLRTDSADYHTDRFCLAISVLVLVSFIPYFFCFFCSVRQIKLTIRQLLAHYKHFVSYYTVSQKKSSHL